MKANKLLDIFLAIVMFVLFEFYVMAIIMFVLSQFIRHSQLKWE